MLRPTAAPVSVPRRNRQDAGTGVGERRRLEARVVGLQMQRGEADWFEHTFMLAVRVWHARMFGMEGTLLSLRTEPIGNGSAQLFSALVYGIGCQRVPCMWTLGRMEWLALELVVEASLVLLGGMNDGDDAFWRVIEQKLQRQRSDIDLKYCLCPT